MVQRKVGGVLVVPLEVLQVHLHVLVLPGHGGLLVTQPLLALAHLHPKHLKLPSTASPTEMLTWLISASILSRRLMFISFCQPTALHQCTHLLLLDLDQDGLLGVGHCVRRGRDLAQARRPEVLVVHVRRVDELACVRADRERHAPWWEGRQ